VAVRAEGVQADQLRNEFQAHSQEELNQRNLQRCADRFGWARRVRRLKFHDDRVKNRFFMAEIFEIHKFMRTTADPKKWSFETPSHWIKKTLTQPDPTPRRSPFALSHPCQILHSIEIRTPSVGTTMNLPLEPKVSVDSEFVQFWRRRRVGSGSWTMEFSLTTCADAVPPEKIAKHQRDVQQIWNAAVCQLTLPRGVKKPAAGPEFGELRLTAPSPSDPIPEERGDAPQQLNFPNLKLAFAARAWPRVKILDDKVRVYAKPNIDAEQVCLLTDCPEARMGAEVNGFLNVQLADGQEGSVLKTTSVFRMRELAVDQDSVAIYKLPDEASPVLATLSKGASLTLRSPLMQQNGADWLEVSTAQGEVGFINTTTIQAAPTKADKTSPGKSGGLAHKLFGFLRR
jgi:hypothetical protein